MRITINGVELNEAQAFEVARAVKLWAETTALNHEAVPADGLRAILDRLAEVQRLMESEPAAPPFGSVAQLCREGASQSEIGAAFWAAAKAAGVLDA